MVGSTTSMARKPTRRRVPCASERRGETSSAALAAMNSRRFIRSSSLFEDDGTQSITSRLWPHPLRVQMLRVSQDGYGSFVTQMGIPRQVVFPPDSHRI